MRAVRTIMDQVDEIKAKIDIVSLISEYFPLKRAGRNYKAVCPFHGEKTPSFMVSPERQIFKCFGCGQGGDIFGFLMNMEGVEFGEALRILAKKAGVKLVRYQPTKQEEEKDRFYQLNHLTSEFYHYLLTSHPVGKKALEYLKNRQISLESIKLFKIGCAPANPNALFKFLTVKKNFLPDELFRAGLISRSANGNYDFFRDRLVFPLQDHRGNFVGFSGRTIGVWDENTSFGPKYLNTPETPVYQKGNLLYGLETTRQEIKAKNQAIIVEGELDLISSYQAGILNVVAIKGSALTEFQAKLLKRFTDNIALSLDMDSAGDKATWRGIEIADSEGLNVRVVRLPEGKDPDDLARKDPKALLKAIEEAIPAYDFFLESTFNRFDSKTSEGKRKIGQEVLPVLSRISDDLVKAHYIQKLASKLDLPMEAILAQMGKAKPEVSVRGLVNELTEKENDSRREMMEKYLFSLALQKNKTEKLKEESIIVLINSPVLKRILELLSKEKGKFQSEKFSQNLPSELIENFNNLYLMDFGEKIEDDSWWDKEWEIIVFELKKEILKEKINLIPNLIKQAEEKKDMELLTILEKEFKIHSVELAKLISKRV